MRDLRSKRSLEISTQPQTSIDTANLINLGSGTPDFQVPAFIVEAMLSSVRDGKLSYTAWAGMPELRKAVAAKLLRQNSLEVDPDSEVLITTGAQEALMATLMTILDPGDEVLITDPHYGVYSRVSTIIGAKMVAVPTEAENGFVPTIEDIRAAITPRTRALILVSPSNPTGAVFPREVLQGLVDLAVEHDLVIVSDEIYEDYVFDGVQHTTVATLPGAAGRTVSIYSLSKGYALTGIRIGYLTAPAELVQAIMPFHHAMTICAPVTAQYGAIAALSQDRSWFAPILAEYDQRRRLWMTRLEAMSLPFTRPHGAYYVFFDVSGTGLDAKTFVKRAASEAKVTLGTGGSCAGEGWLRGSLMAEPAKLEEGLGRLQAFVRSLNG